MLLRSAVSVSSQSVAVPTAKAQALRMIDACARFLYRALFQSVLRRFALSIAAKASASAKRKEAALSIDNS